jgi:hypothetical protein
MTTADEVIRTGATCLDEHETLSAAAALTRGD